MKNKEIKLAESTYTYSSSPNPYLIVMVRRFGTYLVYHTLKNLEVFLKKLGATR